MEDVLISKELPEIKNDDVNSTSEPIDLAPIQKYLFGRDQVTPMDKDQMAFVWDYFSKGSTGPGVTLGKISDLERSINRAGGMERLDAIYSYTKLLAQQGDINEEIRAYAK